jgi:hypothetical protein
MRYKDRQMRVAFTFIIYLLTASSAFAADLLPSNDSELCSTIKSTYERALSDCGMMPSECVLRALVNDLNELSRYTMAPILEERYGNGLSKSDLEGNNEQFSLIHIHKFNGFRHGDTEQTWLVFKEQLDNLSKKPYDKFDAHFIYEPNFQDVLLAGEKIADNYVYAWKYGGRDILIENEYDGHTVGGGGFVDTFIYRTKVYGVEGVGGYDPICHIEFTHNKSLKQDAQ